MNKYIKTDIEQGVQYLKIGIMNALADIESGEKEIILGDYIPFSLIVKCAEEREWKSWYNDLSEDFDTNGWEVDCWYYMWTPDNKYAMISSCLWKGQKTSIALEDYNKWE
jgi:hypothetical protein